MTTTTEIRYSHTIESRSKSGKALRVAILTAPEGLCLGEAHHWEACQVAVAAGARAWRVMVAGRLAMHGSAGVRSEAGRSDGCYDEIDGR